MKDTTISFKVDRVLKTKLVSLAKAENRSLSNYIEKILKEELRNTPAHFSCFRQALGLS